MDVTSATKPSHVKKMNSVKDRDFNIVLLGQGGVGKSGTYLFLTVINL